MNNQDKQVRNWKAIAATSVVVALAAVIALLVIGVKEFRDSFVKPAAESTVVTDATVAESSETEITEVTETTAEPEITETEVAEDIDYLSLWTSDAEAKKALVSYMEAITDEKSPDYIPVEDRIAVFDMDGTILCETDLIISITAYWFTVCSKILHIRIRLLHSKRMLQHVSRQSLTETRLSKYQWLSMVRQWRWHLPV